MHGLKTELNVWLLETQISHSSQISCVSCRHCTIKYTVKLCSFNCFQTTFIVNKAALKHYIKICCILVSIKRTMNLRLTWSSHWDLHLSKLLGINYSHCAFMFCKESPQITYSLHASLTFSQQSPPCFLLYSSFEFVPFSYMLSEKLLQKL